MKFNLNKENVLKILKLNNVPSENSGSPELIKAKRNIYLQAGLAILTIVLTIVIIFSMTAAWYTNIAETSGLIFEVETWGYTGEVKIAGGPISAAPGDSGVVALSVDGGSEEILDVKVTVTKDAMLDEMQKRLFFYVDTPATLNDETVERVYVNSISDYTYTLLSQGSVIMSEDFSNVPELKWQWVYDVLGYYVLADETEGFNIVEYLRPIEYDYDKATFAPATVTLTTDEGETDISAKKIATVDGTLTPEEFLEKFSETDGYDGVLNIQTEEETDGDSYSEYVDTENGNYYKIGEDENGRGIYAYLCSYSEIELATGYDTDLGMAMNDPEESGNLRFTATVYVSVEQKNVEAVSVSDKSGFVEAIETAEDGAFIKLEHNIDMGTDFIDIPEGAEVWIDLGGNTITSGVTGTNGAIVAQKGSSLTVVNGKLEGNGGKTGRGIEAIGAEVNISNVDITGFDRGINISDEKSLDTDSTVRVSGCTVDGVTCAVFVSGNGTGTGNKTQLIVDKCTLTSKLYGIVGNGSDNRVGTDIQVLNSTVKSEGAGIYHPQRNSTLTVYNSTVEGYTGISIKGGHVEFINSWITGSGEAYDGELEGSNSGSAATGDAIYIENNYEKNSISVVIKQNESADSENILKETKLESKNDHALRVYDKTLGNVKIVIYKGTFVGLGSLEASWIDDGSTQYPQGEKTVIVTPATAVDDTE